MLHTEKISLSSIACRALLIAAVLTAPTRGQDIPSSVPATTGISQNPNNYSPIPGPPQRPTNNARPDSWPGGPVPQNTPPRGTYDPTQGTVLAPATTAPEQVGPKPGQQFDTAEIIARIGTEVVQAGEVLPAINEQITHVLSQAGTQTVPQDQIDAFRYEMMKKLTLQLIDMKLLVAEAKRKIPAENLPKIEEKSNDVFTKNQLPKLMESTKAVSRSDLEAKLRQNGSSIEAMRRQFFERSMAFQWLSQQVKEDGEITHEEMLIYYRDHISTWETPARARWDHLAARFDKYDTKAEAFGAIASWGNLILQGKPWAEVAKAHSDDLSSFDGGLHDWTTKDSLVSKVLDEALFGLPVGQPSRILEDEKGFHIIRVVEREDLSRKPFIEAQVEIKKKIKDERISKQKNDYLNKLRERTPVWIVFGDYKTLKEATATK